MQIKKGNTSIHIPCWLIALGIMAVDSIASNICKVKALKKTEES